MYNNYFKKNIVGLFLFFLLFLSTFVFAGDDCNNISIIFKENRIFSESDINIARSHLLSYCCREKKIEPNSQCEGAKIGPDSPYWYDHLIDIGIRKLSAREEDLYDDLQPDEDGKAWIDFIYGIEDQKTPEIISQKYEEFWTLNLIPDPNKLQESVDKFNSEPNEEITLHDKYINLCLVVFDMYKESGYGPFDIKTDGYYTKCLNLIRSKINQEKVLALGLSQNAGSNLLLDSRTSYLNQFVQNRLMKLKDKIVDIYSLFNIVARQAPLSDKCME